MTASEVVALAINNKNFDTALIKDDYILAAELDDIKPALGDDFYDTIVADTATYATLLTYIKKALAFFTLVKALPFIHVHLNTTGINVPFADNARDATDRQRADMTEACQRIGEVHLQEAKRYLEDNNTLAIYDLWSGNSRQKFGGLLLY